MAYPRISRGFPYGTVNPAQLIPPNPWTECLIREQFMWENITRLGGLDRLCCPAKQSGENPPFIVMPPEGRTYKSIGSVLVGDLVQGTDTVVTSFRVPTGYDSVITQVLNLYTGAGFIEGSGMLTWRIRINSPWLKNYGAIDTTLGSLQSPCMINRGSVQLMEHSLVRYYVNISAAGVAALDPTQRIVCGFFGWHYPQ